MDIGAFESGGFTISVTSGSGQSTAVLTAFSAPLVATVTAKNANEPVAGGIVTFTSPQSGASATLMGSPATISAAGTVSVTAAANGIGGTYAITAGARGIATSASFSLTNKWVPTFSVSSETIVYGTSTTALTGHLGSGTAYPTGSIVSITLDSVTQTSTVSASGSFTTTFNTASLAVADSPYTVSYVFAGNSTFTAAMNTSTTVTVTPAPLTITADGVTRVYGASDPTLGVSYTGFVNGETSAVLGGTLTVTDSDAAPTTGVGAYSGVITASGQTATNYTITYVAGNLTVTPAPLTITAESLTKTYGQTVTLDDTDFTTNGLVNSDSVSSVSLSSTGTAATATVAGSPYAIIASGAVGSGLSNYTITYVNGSLTVTPAPLTITADNETKTYGQTETLTGTDFTTSGLVNSDSVSSVSLSSTGAAGTAAVAGSPYAIIASGAVGSGLSNYTISYVNGSLTVTPAPLTITADDVTRVYGASDPTLGVSYTGFVNGETSAVLGGTLTVTDSDAAPTTGVGAYSGVITASGQTATNYTITYVAGNLTVTPAPLTITAESLTKTYGQTVTLDDTDFTTNGLVNSDSVSSCEPEQHGYGGDRHCGRLAVRDHRIWRRRLGPVELHDHL